MTSLCILYKQYFPLFLSLLTQLYICKNNFPQFFISDLSIPFPSEREADVAYQTLRVDAEPSRSGVTKTLTLESNTLKVYVNYYKSIITQ